MGKGAVLWIVQAIRSSRNPSTGCWIAEHPGEDTARGSPGQGEPPEDNGRITLTGFCILHTLAVSEAKDRKMQKLKISIDNPRPLGKKIGETIRGAIVNGQLPAGTRVAEPDLAERFGISRTPIREAFRQLESEGFITVVPRKGAVVASFFPRMSPTSTT